MKNGRRGCLFHYFQFVFITQGIGVRSGAGKQVASGGSTNAGQYSATVFLPKGRVAFAKGIDQIYGGKAKASQNEGARQQAKTAFFILPWQAANICHAKTEFKGAGGIEPKGAKLGGHLHNLVVGKKKAVANDQIETATYGHAIGGFEFEILPGVITLYGFAVFFEQQCGSLRMGHAG